jgi:hypothetical protein
MQMATTKRQTFALFDAILRRCTETAVASCVRELVAAGSHMSKTRLLDEVEVDLVEIVYMLSEMRANGRRVRVRDARTALERVVQELGGVISDDVMAEFDVVVAGR